jgi:Rps23 Pro-64 3,4-dihydroxylase Tpa1-like proline 4-hydroxylase
MERNKQVTQATLTKMLLLKLSANKKVIKDQWNNPVGTSTRYFYIDNLLSNKICSDIYKAFPKDGKGFFSRESFREKKKTSANLNTYEPILSDITYAFQDKKVINLIARLVGFKDIEADPLLYAGGLSMMFKGDFLNPHIDNSHDAARKRYRKLNLLYYVSPNWRIENGGNLELWDKSRKIPKTIFSKTNRLIVMETNNTSWHSVSAINVNDPRCCVSNYYFSEISPNNEVYFHVTSFTGRPNEVFKKALGIIDNLLRNSVSKILKVGRGKGLINRK